jgi:hypothetical protein
VSKVPGVFLYDGNLFEGFSNFSTQSVFRRDTGFLLPSQVTVYNAPSEHLFWSRDYSTIQSLIAGSFAYMSKNNSETYAPADFEPSTTTGPMGSQILIRHSVNPLVLPETFVEGVKLSTDVNDGIPPCLAGYALGFKLLKSKGGRKHFWYKMKAKMHRKSDTKQAKTDGKDINESKKKVQDSVHHVPGYKWYSNILELSHITENPRDVPDGIERPHWMLLLFKAMASYIYKFGDADSRRYLCVVRLNHLTYDGYLNEASVVYALTKYFDFAVCVHPSIAGKTDYEDEEEDDDTDGGRINSAMYKHLKYDLVMSGAKIAYTTIGPDRVPQTSFVPVDATEPYLIRPLPTIAELWKMFMFAYQDFFADSLKIGIPEGQKESLYEYLWADTSLQSSSMKWPGCQTNFLKHDIQDSDEDEEKPKGRGGSRKRGASKDTGPLGTKQDIGETNDPIAMLIQDHMARANDGTSVSDDSEAARELWDKYCGGQNLQHYSPDRPANFTEKYALNDVSNSSDDSATLDVLSLNDAPNVFPFPDL